MLPYFYSVNEYLKKTYGVKMYKLALNGYMTCPNRDGTIGARGCTFCSAGGSGDFAGDMVRQRQSPERSGRIDICDQIEAAKTLISKKYDGSDYIAYFQSYTNTYADADYLRNLFMPVITRDDIRILSIATRPDCLGRQVIELLDELNHIKPVWIELGLQTIHEKTARNIRRGYELKIYENAVLTLNSINVKTITHMIIGLPGEDEKMMTDTARYLARSGTWGIKLQLLHVLKGTDLEKDYRNNLFKTLSMDEYFALLGEIIEILPPDTVIHRLTGDGPKKILTAPMWSADKKKCSQQFNAIFKEK